ncbi:MAG: hypothetical protein PHH77_10925 [Victivallaceae bacterium]|nr:hypothetical protein [Victivallaceae bacterium]
MYEANRIKSIAKSLRKTPADIRDRAAKETGVQLERLMIQVGAMESTVARIADELETIAKELEK